MDDNQNEISQLSQQDADIIGEVSNISMGSAATALSNIMGKKVIITSPHVEVASVEAIDGIQRVPSIGVQISYTEGVVGSDILIIRQADATEIVKVMMGDEMAGEEFGEIQISAIAEVMNQMMGSSATALSNFLGKSVNISPPSAFLMTEENRREKLATLYSKANQVIMVRFLFKVEDIFESDLYIMMTKDFSTELVNAMMSNLDFIPDDSSEEAAPESAPQPETQEEEPAPSFVPPMPEPQYAPQPEPQYAPQPEPQYAPQPEPQPEPQYTPQPSYIPQPAPSPAPQYAPQQAAQYAPPYVPQGTPSYYSAVQSAATAMPQTRVRPVSLANFDSQPDLEPSQKSNFELIEEVPLELAVEVGKAKKMVKEVIDLTVGSIIELDKQAGDPVDIIVNGQLIAHGEVVVIDESFGVRITEIIDKKNQVK